jgi:hypothetical protein
MRPCHSNEYIFSNPFLASDTFEALGMPIHVKCEHLLIINELYAPFAVSVSSMDETLLAKKFVLLLVITWKLNWFEEK